MSGGNDVAVGATVGAGCILLVLALIALRIITLVIGITDLVGGHDHIVLDVILLLLAW